tara:strand:+ start:669 stop:917 length:249 start_codon:yes stop_codon:yes gene_type:complete
MGSFKDYKNAPEKFKNSQEFTEEQLKEIFKYIKEKSVAQKPIKDAIIAMENNCTKYIGKWKTFAVGGYGYGGIINLFQVQEV